MTILVTLVIDFRVDVYIDLDCGNYDYNHAFRFQRLLLLQPNVDHISEHQQGNY